MDGMLLGKGMGAGLSFISLIAVFMLRLSMLSRRESVDTYEDLAEASLWPLLSIPSILSSILPDDVVVVGDTRDATDMPLFEAGETRDRIGALLSRGVGLSW